MYYISLIEPVLRLVIAAEFAFLAVAGAAAAAQAVALDAKLRKAAREQTEMLAGVKAASEAKAAEKEKRRRARLAAALEEMV